MTSRRPVTRRAPIRMWSESGVGVIMMLAVMATAAPALATFAGHGGHLAYELAFQDTSGNSTFPIGIDGSPITSPATNEFDNWPAFSPDGNQLAFVERASGSPTTIELMSAGGGAHATVLSSTAISPSATIYAVTWLSDGQHVAFSAVETGGGSFVSSVWTVALNGSDLTELWIKSGPSQSAFEVEGSPVDASVLFRCRVRTNANFQEIDDYCIVGPLGTQLVPIESPNTTITGRGVFKGHWDPTGTHIIFPMDYVSTDLAPPCPPNNCNVGCGMNGYHREEIFRVRTDGSELTELTHPPLVFQCNPDFLWKPRFQFRDALPSPDGRTIAANGWEYGPGTGTTAGIFMIDLGAGDPPLQPTLVAPVNQPPPVHLDWQALPQSLSVSIDDGINHPVGGPLKGMKVQLLTYPDKTAIGGEPIETTGGTYVFPHVAPGDYYLTASLVDDCRTDGCAPAFTIRYAPEPTDPVLATFFITVGSDDDALQLHFDAADPHFNSDNLSDAALLLLDDMAAIYFQTRRYVDWVKGNLVSDLRGTVSFYTFASADPFGNPFDPLQIGAYYLDDHTAVVMNPRESEYENRDGIIEIGPMAHPEDAPQSVEWHEFTHYLYHSFVNNRTASCSSSYVPHAGYNNPDTCDSMDEGFCEFLPVAAAVDLPVAAVGEGVFDHFGYDFDETKFKPWGFRLDPEGETDVEMTLTSEDFAVAALFWDLFDDDADTEDTRVVGADGLHHPVTYTDAVVLGVRGVWNQVTTFHPATVRDLRNSFGTPALTVDLDGDGVKDIAPLDEVFLMHGMFPIDDDETIAGSHLTYHYDVGYAQRRDASALRDAAVGLTSHHVLDATGAVKGTLIPRFQPPAQPNANVELHVLDDTGAPLPGTTHILTLLTDGSGSGTTTGAGTYGTLTAMLDVQHPSGRVQTIRRQLASGDGALVHLELPPYFDYLLPDGATLPPCDPTTDVVVQVAVGATRNGNVATDTPTFDNCTYQQAMATAAGPAALSVTLTVPGPLTPTAQVSATPAAGSRFAGWSGPDAVECATGAVAMTADKSCTATFLQEFTMTTDSFSNDGCTGTISGAGTYDAGEIAMVAPVPDPGATFLEWIGPSGAECATGSVIMDRDKVCDGAFGCAAPTTSTSSSTTSSTSTTLSKHKTTTTTTRPPSTTSTSSATTTSTTTTTRSRHKTTTTTTSIVPTTTTGATSSTTTTPGTTSTTSTTPATCGGTFPTCNGTCPAGQTCQAKGSHCTCR